MVVTVTTPSMIPRSCVVKVGWPISTLPMSQMTAASRSAKTSGGGGPLSKSPPYSSSPSNRIPQVDWGDPRRRAERPDM